MTATLRIRPSERDAARPRPAIRVLPVPPLEPPTDEELARAGIDPHVVSHLAQPLPLHLPGRAAGSNAPPRDTTRASTRQTTAASTSTLTSTGTPASTGTHRSTDTRGSTGTGASAAPLGAPGVRPGGGVREVRPGVPTARVAVHRFVAACVEVLGGYRPATQLRALCAADRFATVIQQLSSVGASHGSATTPGAVPARPGRTPVTTRPATGAPPRSPRQVQVPPQDRATIRRVHIGEPVDGVAEVVVLLEQRHRTRAMTLRLELRDDRWICAHLHVL